MVSTRSRMFGVTERRTVVPRKPSCYFGGTGLDAT